MRDGRAKASETGARNPGGWASKDRGDRPPGRAWAALKVLDGTAVAADLRAGLSGGRPRGARARGPVPGSDGWRSDVRSNTPGIWGKLSGGGGGQAV